MVVPMADNLNIKKRYEALFKYSNDIVLIINLDGKVLVANEKALSIMGSSIVGNKIDRIFEGIASHLESSRNTQIVQSVYAQNKAKAVNRHHFKISLIPVLDKDKVSEVVLVGKDLKEIESYQGEVERLKEKIHLLDEEKRIRDSGLKKGDRKVSLAVAMKKLEVANQKLKDMFRTLNNELELAAILQKSLVPDNLIEHEHINFAFHYEPMGHVGGDYYDVIDIDKNKKGVILADVSGHGVSSAFIAAMFKISFTNYAPEHSSPADVLKKLNREYCNMIQTGDYVTAFYAIFDTVKKRIEYSGAGHPKPLFLHNDSNKVELLSSEGFFIGMFEEADYSDTVLDFFEGDRFLAYTDGIIEAYSEEKNEQYGENRLLKSFQKYKKRPVDQMLQLIITDVERFMNKSKFYDDLAMVAVEYKKQGVKR